MELHRLRQPGIDPLAMSEEDTPAPAAFCHMESASHFGKTVLRHG